MVTMEDLQKTKNEIDEDAWELRIKLLEGLFYKIYALCDCLAEGKITRKEFNVGKKRVQEDLDKIAPIEEAPDFLNMEQLTPEGHHV